MALTITKEADKSLIDACGGNVKFVRGLISFDTSYPTGGEAFDLSGDIPTEVQVVLIENKAGYFFEYDKANKKVIAYESGADGGANDEVGNTTDLATAGCTSIGFLAIGW
jgi:hypothetical protein